MGRCSVKGSILQSLARALLRPDFRIGRAKLLAEPRRLANLRRSKIAAAAESTAATSTLKATAGS
jgi:hypothetical protein